MKNEIKFNGNVFGPTMPLFPAIFCSKFHYFCNILTLAQESCWNGQEPGSYDVKVAEDGLAHQINNPEVAVKIDLGHSLLNEQKFR